MTLNEASEKFHVSTDRLREYEANGLLENSKYSENKYDYSEEFVRRICLINLLLRSGMDMVQDTEIGSGKVLVAFFSWGGNTKGIAEEMRSQTDADLFEIELVNPYSDDYNTVLDEAQRDQNVQTRPESKNKVENMTQ